MGDSAAFEWICDQLEERTALNRLEARGTVRLALKKAGLEPSRVVPAQMKVLIEKRLCDELAACGVGDATRLCDSLAAAVGAIDAGPPGVDSPDDVFRRLGRS